MQKSTITIVGHNEAALLLAALLETEKHKVILVDTGDNFSTKLTGRHNCLPIFANNQENRDALNFLSLKFSLNLDQPTAPAALTPTTMDGEITKPFLGFGDMKSEQINALSLYNSNHHATLQDNFLQFMYSLAERLNSSVHKFSEVTQIALLANENKASHLIINGNETVAADTYIFMVPPTTILPIIPDNFISSRTRGRIAKTTSYARVSIEIRTKEPLKNKDELVFLNPTQADQLPIVGCRLLAGTETAPNDTHSFIWECYVSSELIDDSEYMTTTLRNMRKLVRKAFPATAENCQEIISVTEHAFADFNWMSADKELSSMPDNFVISGFLPNHNNGIMRCVQEALQAYKTLKRDEKKHVNMSPDSIEASV